MTTPVTETTPRKIPTATELINSKKVWTLYFRYGSVPFLHKNFIHDGNMLDAINRARQHCIIMGYKFICVRPFLIDLDEQEKRREEGNQDS